MDYLYSPVLNNLIVQMLPFKTLIAIRKNAAMPVYRQIANSLIRLIQDGILKPGAPLPASREMASIL